MKHTAAVFAVKIFAVAALLSAVATLAVYAASTGSADDLQGLVVANAKIPIYNKDRLQMVFFADRAERGSS
jgi:hypothetical protein